MTLRVTNTLTGEKEEFEPHDPDSVLFYYCGLTTSDPSHLGHARGWVHVDVMCRWLRWLGYDVHHVENFTDVNEKIVARVGENGDSEAEVARHYVQSTIDDMRSLNLERAEVYPRVSEHIPEIIALVETIIEEGYAYESSGSVYFDVTSFEEYGTLSNQQIDEMESQRDQDERGDKRHPMDFALWKADGVDPGAIADHRHDGAVPAEESCSTAQTWDSPWGEGRPGWHVECSAMSMAHLDESIDVHVGGQDLVFPHHENEIAQSEAATGEQFATYWLHVRLLETKGEKMSSSLGNYFTTSEAVGEYGVDVVRTFLLSTAYHNSAIFSKETIGESIDRWDRLERGYERAVEAVDDVDASATTRDESLRAAVAEAREDFVRAMNDDFNTRQALVSLTELIGAVNVHLDDGERTNDDSAGSDGHRANEDITFDYRGLREAIETVDEFGGDVLGLTFSDEPSGEISVAGDLIDIILEMRERERDAGNYDRADGLRDDLEALGVEIQDTDEGSTYRIE